MIKFYRGECLGSPHTGYGGGILDFKAQDPDSTSRNFPDSGFYKPDFLTWGDYQGCHCGNDNQNVTNTIAFTLGKQQLSPCIILFFYMSLPSLHDYDLNGLISRYIENVNIRLRISLSLFKPEYLS